jgi:hypothetical protein
MTYSSTPRLILVVLAFSGFSAGCNPEPERAKPATANTKTTPSKEAKPLPSPPNVSEAARSEVEALCEKSCQTTEPLGCLSATLCKRQCLENFVLPVCQKEFLGVLTCATHQPAESWSCAPHSAPVMKDGVCANEQEAAMTCVASKVPLQQAR